MRHLGLALTLALAGCAGGSKGLDETLEGSLDDKDPRLDDGGPYDAFSFSAKKGERLTAALSSEDFDPVLHLLGKGERRLATNDDARFGHTEARLEAAIPEDGEYKLVLRAAKGEERGAYRLTVTVAAAP